jgi:hypothetical protein
LNHRAELGVSNGVLIIFVTQVKPNCPRPLAGAEIGQYDRAAKIALRDPDHRQTISLAAGAKWI